MIGLAILFGGLAVWVSRSWLDMQTSQRLSELEAERSAVELSTIVVADQPLRFGMSLDASHLREIEWPSSQLPSGAYSRIPQIMEAGERVVLAPIERNEPLLSTKITGPGQRGTLSAVIGDGMRAVTVRVNDVAGVAGFVLPEDRVDVVLTRQTERGEGVAEVLLQGVRVLAVDQLADQRSQDPTLAKAVTLEVDTRSAQKLALASAVGNLSLVLRRAGEMAAEFTQRITMGDLTAPPVFASAAREPLPVDSEVDAAPANTPSSGSANATVGVVRATQRSEYSVPVELQ
jgi:pilus assembly protein CpaB